VSSTEQLTQALAEAKAGDVIALGPGVFRGPVRLEAVGTASAPIVLCGQGPGVSIVENPTYAGYTLYLKNARFVVAAGLGVRGGDKAVIVENANDNVLTNLDISGSGQEGIHFWNGSSRNTLSHSTVHDTGKRNAGTGEGIYIGRARDKWAQHTNGKADRCDGNRILDNRVWNTPAECIDVKEGTTGGILRGNVFDGSTLSGEHFADSWVALKGNRYLVENNQGKVSNNHGMEIQVRSEGWGRENVLRGNVLEVNGPGYGIAIQKEVLTKNTVSCDNRVVGAKLGFSNGACQP
jgi:parallel beta-helix repeat protein